MVPRAFRLFGYDNCDKAALTAELAMGKLTANLMSQVREHGHILARIAGLPAALVLGVIAGR